MTVLRFHTRLRPIFCDGGPELMDAQYRHVDAGVPVIASRSVALRYCLSINQPFNEEIDRLFGKERPTTQFDLLNLAATFQLPKRSTAYAAQEIAGLINWYKPAWHSHSITH
jgi:hypothetical protein